MNKKETAWRAILTLNALECFCGSRLRVLKVKKFNNNYLVLQVTERETAKCFALYDIRLRKVVAPGTFSPTLFYNDLLDIDNEKVNDFISKNFGKY